MLWIKNIRNRSTGQVLKHNSNDHNAIQNQSAEGFSDIAKAVFSKVTSKGAKK